MFTLFLRKRIYSCKLFNVPIQEFSSQKSISKYGNQDCFSVEYLMKKYGISMDKAVYGNKVVSFFQE
ncbi:hypothetical protein LIER_43487 [Lithospermum erythrorhizon]|uniref:Uncharacterized protein n=1 Tax=Lithospermum erythrorhizon TaxID=34254 RepID=A0AAV3QAK9_LITER